MDWCALSQEIKSLMKEFILGFEDRGEAEQGREHKCHELCYQKTKKRNKKRIRSRAVIKELTYDVYVAGKVTND
jgi:hypothetical protein